VEDNKTKMREGEFELNGRTTKRNRLVMISAVIVVTAVLLAILFSTVLADHQPAIASLEAKPERVLLLGSCQIACNALDPDGDELSYGWSANGGEINGEGAVATWTVPEEIGMYDVTVTVEDGQSRKDKAAIVLIASNGPPLLIEDLIITTDHKYLKETATTYKALKNEEYYIECIASNTNGELVYEWSCDDGEISGEGSMITWTAPNTEVDVTVTVKVIDGVSNWIRESMAFEVVYC